MLCPAVLDPKRCAEDEADTNCAAKTDQANVNKLRTLPPISLNIPEIGNPPGAVPTGRPNSAIFPNSIVEPAVGNCPNLESTGTPIWAIAVRNSLIVRRNPFGALYV